MKRIPIIDALQNVVNNEHGSVTFHFEEGGVQVQPLSTAFFEDEKGKPLPLNRVASKISDISHDLGAKYYVVE